MKLKDAQHLAGELIQDLEPACQRLEVAGSVRRERPEVKDLELVAIPRWEEAPAEQLGLFGEERVALNVLHRAVLRHPRLRPIKPGVPGLEPWSIQPDGKYWRLHLFGEGLKVDLFLCSEETWGLVYCIRTGSADFSKALLARWKQVSGGGKAEEGRLYTGEGELLETPGEKDVFAACQVAWMEPAEREMAAMQPLWT